MVTICVLAVLICVCLADGSNPGRKGTAMWWWQSLEAKKDEQKGQEATWRYPKLLLLLSDWAWSGSEDDQRSNHGQDMLSVLWPYTSQIAECGTERKREMYGIGHFDGGPTDTGSAKTQIDAINCHQIWPRPTHNLLPPLHICMLFTDRTDTRTDLTWNFNKRNSTYN